MNSIYDVSTWRLIQKLFSDCRQLSGHQQAIKPRYYKHTYFPGNSWKDIHMYVGEHHNQQLDAQTSDNYWE